MIIQCLIVKTYKGQSLARQKEIVQQLGFSQTGRLLWSITVETIEQVKTVESGIKGKVPYIKILP